MHAPRVQSKWITSRKVRFIVSEGSAIENAEPKRYYPERPPIKTLDFYARRTKIIAVRSKKNNVYLVAEKLTALNFKKKWKIQIFLCDSFVYLISNGL